MQKREDVLMTLHSGTYKNKKVYVVMKNGQEFVDRFIDSKSNYIFLDQKGKLNKKSIRTLTIYRHQTHENTK